MYCYHIWDGTFLNIDKIFSFSSYLSFKKHLPNFVIHDNTHGGIIDWEVKGLI